MYSPPQREDSSLTPAFASSPNSVPKPAPAQTATAADSSALESSELSAALQLLVERAQYITGATGAALALPQNSEMVCRASTGSCAPAIGARLQVRSGLTGESIASRRLLRCDNAESDPRVNLEVCRALGIASIVVLPLLRDNAKDGEVCGLFELLSDHPYAFEERDLVALERMADLALTALDLATQPHSQPKEKEEGARPQSSHPTSDHVHPDREQPGRPEISHSQPMPMPAWPTGKSPSPALDWSTASNPLPSSRIARSPDLQSPALQSPDVPPHDNLPRDLHVHDFQADASQINGSKINDFQKTDLPTTDLPTSDMPITDFPITDSSINAKAVASSLPIAIEATHVSPTAAGVPAATAPVPTLAPNLPATPAESERPALLPEAMRLAQKCSACGFPVSQGRTLCLDCEQKARTQTQKPQSPNVQSQNVKSGNVLTLDLRPENVQSAAPRSLDVRTLDAPKQDIPEQGVVNNDIQNNQVQNNRVQNNEVQNNYALHNKALGNEVLSPAPNQPPTARADSSLLPSDRLANLASDRSSDISPSDVLPPFLANAEPFKESWFSNLRNLLLVLVLIVGAFVLYVVLH